MRIHEVVDSDLQETWQHTVDINQLAAVCVKWIESQNPQGPQQTATVAELAKKAGIFSSLRKDTQKYILDDHFYRNPLTITVDFASPQGAAYGYYNQGNHNIRILYKTAKSFGLAEAIAHELQHAIDEIRIAWHAYQGDPVKVTDMVSFRKYLKDPSEINARLAEVLFKLSQMNITTQQLPGALATLLDQHHLSPRGKFPLGNSKYKKLLSRSYKFYANSKTLQQQRPAKTMWEKIKYYAARVAEAVLGP
jgi:hypothetical protein